MGGLTNSDYHRIRASDELEQAARSADLKIAELHRELAILHLVRASENEAGHVVSILDKFRTRPRKTAIAS